MKKLYSIHVRSLIFLMLIVTLLGLAPMGHAQSIQNWSESINLSMSGSASNPALVVDSLGVLHVVWVDEFDGYKYAQSTDGLTWTSPETVKFPFSKEALPPVFLADVNGSIHIFWLSEDNELSYAQTLSENLDTPSAWRVKGRVDTSVYDFDANMDMQGGIHIGYVKNPAPIAGQSGVFYKRSTDGGLSWGKATLLFESSYFRSLTAENAHIRIAVSENPDEESVYIVWDDRSQKRIFMAISADGGSNWSPANEMITPQASLGFRTPYHADIDVLQDRVLVTWQVGEPGVRCTPYSQTSSNGGETWDEPVKILAESAQCPESSEFISIDPRYSTSLFTIQGDLSLSAWNGSDWSEAEVQTGPLSITNPATFDSILLGCERAVPYLDWLFVVGCDEGESGGDIWFIARQLDPVDDLFPLPSAWGGEAEVTTAPRTLSSLSSVADGTGNIHAVWVQSSFLPTDTFEPVIDYARWNGTEWARPSPIITDLNGMPLNLSLQIDQQERLLLSWVNQQTGELMFTWSAAERANIPLEWKIPVVLSASSKLTDSPDILVDATDRIVIAYAITLNEERGIYVIQSTDLGGSWSAPVRAFDAVSEGWEMVDQPKLAVTADGTLHVLFTQYAFLGEPQPVRLYYSQSGDGGFTWTPAEIVSEQPVQWSEFVAYQGTIHRLWQEKNKLVARTIHQSSLDGGKTWDSPVRLPSDAGINSKPSVSVDGAGDLHFVQVIEKDDRVFEEWTWSAERWQLVETRKVAVLELNSPPIVESGINMDGHIYAIFQFEERLDDGIEANVFSISRSLEMAEPASPFWATISTPSSSSAPMLTPDLQPTPVPTSPLAGLNDPTPKVSRNMIGFVLIVVVVLFILGFVLPRRGRVTDETGSPK